MENLIKPKEGCSYCSGTGRRKHPITGQTQICLMCEGTGINMTEEVKFYVGQQL